MPRASNLVRPGSRGIPGTSKRGPLAEPLLRNDALANRALQQSLEAETTGAKILEELHTQRQGLEVARGSYQSMGADVESTGDSIQRQLQRIERKRLLWVIGAAAAVLVVCVVIYFKVRACASCRPGFACPLRPGNSPPPPVLTCAWPQYFRGASDTQQKGGSGGG